MDIKDLKKHFNCETNRDLQEKIGYSLVTLWKWKKFGIPVRTQALLEIKTSGKLKTDTKLI